MENSHREKILSLLQHKVDEVKTMTPHGIFVNGERIKVGSGKYVWNRKNHASCALTNYLAQFEPQYDWRGESKNWTQQKEAYWAEVEKLKQEGIIEVKPV